MNRRSEKLDKLINELVVIRFSDGEISVGVLEYNEPRAPEFPPSREYSLYRFGAGRLFFRKTHVKNITKWQEPIIIP